MTCPTCKHHFTNHPDTGCNPKNVLEVVKECDPTIFHKVVRPAALGDETETPPEQLDYRNVLLVYEASDHAYLYSSDGIPTGPISTDISKLEQALADLGVKLEQETADRTAADIQLGQQIEERVDAEAELRQNADNALADSIAAEVEAREAGDAALEQRIDDIVNSPDVRYIEATYADLEAIDKATIGDQDYARVLEDETHDGTSTFYQFNKTAQEWEYVGEAGASYSKIEIDRMVADLNAGLEATRASLSHDIENLTELLPIAQNEYTESSTDTYSANYINGRLDSGLVAIGKNAMSGVNNEPVGLGVAIGNGARSSTLGAYNGGVAIGDGARTTSEISYTSQNYAVAIGAGAKAVLPGGSSNNLNSGVAIGYQANCNFNSSIALGSYSTVTRTKTVGVGNRYIEGVRDGVQDQDAVTVHQLNEAVGNINLLLETLISGQGVA